MFDPELLTVLRNARHIAVFTGAGVSAESGIPTFRDAQTGLWEKFDVANLLVLQLTGMIKHWYGVGMNGGE